MVSTYGSIQRRVNETLFPVLRGFVHSDNAALGELDLCISGSFFCQKITTFPYVSFSTYLSQHQ
jgi:hypothetical protein